MLHLTDTTKGMANWGQYTPAAVARITSPHLRVSVLRRIVAPVAVAVVVAAAAADIDTALAHC